MLTMIFADPVLEITPELVEQYTRSLVSVADVVLKGKSRFSSLNSHGYNFTTMIVENGDPTYRDIVFVIIAGPPELGTCLSPATYPEINQFYNEFLSEVREMTDGVMGDYQFMHVMPDGRRCGTYSFVMRKNPYLETMAEELRKLIKAL